METELDLERQRVHEHGPGHRLDPETTRTPNQCLHSWNPKGEIYRPLPGTSMERRMENSPNHLSEPVVAKVPVANQDKIGPTLPRNDGVVLLPTKNEGVHSRANVPCLPPRILLGDRASPKARHSIPRNWTMAMAITITKSNKVTSGRRQTRTTRKLEKRDACDCMEESWRVVVWFSYC